MPESYRLEHDKHYPGATEDERAARYEQSRRTYINELTASLRGERSQGMSARNLADLDRRYPQWETRWDAAKDWEAMWS